MGQEGLFQFLEKLKCSGVPVSTRDLMGVCGEIDLFGTYMPLILRELRHGDTQVKPYEIGRKVGYQLSKHWDMAMLTVYLDGEQSDQKLKARTARGIVRVKNMRELESLLGKMETYSINGKWAPRSIVSTIKKRLGTVYSITDAFKDELQRGIMDSGCTRFVCCEGEADVAIAEELMVRPTLELNGQTFWRMPVSSDSDLLIYASLPGLFRRLRDGTFVLLTKEKVLATLGFQHPRQLVLYGTVSRNDYVTNIRTIGLSKNRDIIRDLIVDWNADMDVLLEAYLLEANSRVAVDDRVDKGHFRHSIAMFFDLRPTYDEKLPSATNMQYMEFSLKFSHLKALRVERKSEQPRSAPKFYIAPGSKPNQYRPTFGSKDTILGSKTRAFRVCDTKERRMPEPRKDPKTKRGKQEVQYQRTQKPVKRKNRVPKEGEPTYEAGHKNKLKASTVVDHRLSRKHPTSTLLVGSVHANIKRALKVPWGSDDDHDDGEGLADLEKEPRIHEVAGQEDTLVDNINAEQEDKEEQNPDAHVLSTSLSNAIGTIQLLRIQLYEVLALDLDRIFGPKLPPGTSSVTLQAPSIASATFQPLAHITPTSSSSVLSPLSPLATPSTDMSPMDTPQPTQKLPGPACTIEQLNLSSADRQDIGDIVSTSLTFYYQVVSLMLNGSLSNNSQYERNRSAPERTMPTRSNKTASRAPLVVPHSVRAYEHYCAVTGVVPFNLRPGATAITTTVPRLAAISVQTSFRQHYLASSVSFGKLSSVTFTMAYPIGQRIMAVQ
ncbi:MAG: hypothetical protein J3R72DRAFT_20183 [Linnemannia gamsii]|nr:MAG: hypothetical protein J3R72DRAFT_20183 [Linnemannia gamsii]